MLRLSRHSQLLLWGFSSSRGSEDTQWTCSVARMTLLGNAGLKKRSLLWFYHEGVCWSLAHKSWRKFSKLIFKTVVYNPCFQHELKPFVHLSLQKQILMSFNSYTLPLAFHHNPVRWMLLLSSIFKT